jgi:hypothetical protein
MNLEKILKVSRKGLDDETGSDSQKGWQDWELVEYAQDAIIEIIKELSCLTADDDFIETLATGTITISGTTGGVSSVSINGFVVTSAAVPFTTDLPTTATALAANITAWSANVLNTNPIKFTAQAIGAVVTISAPAGTGSTPNGYAITSTVTGDMSFVSTTLSGGACLCKLFIIPGQTKYQIHPKVIKITRFKPSLRYQPLLPKTKTQLDVQCPGWELNQVGTSGYSGSPWTYIPDYRNKKVTVVSSPSIVDTVFLDVVRMPYADLDVNVLSAVPEIPEDYHDCIIPWIKRQAFLKVDRETLNMAKSQKFETEFYRKIEQAKTKLDNPQKPAEAGFAPQGMY